MSSSSRSSSTRTVQMDNSLGATFHSMETGRRLASQIMGFGVCHQYIPIFRGRGRSLTDQQNTLLTGYMAFVDSLIANSGSFQMSGRPCTAISDGTML